MVTVSSSSAETRAVAVVVAAGVGDRIGRFTASFRRFVFSAYSYRDSIESYPRKKIFQRVRRLVDGLGFAVYTIVFPLVGFFGHILMTEAYSTGYPVKHCKRRLVLGPSLRQLRSVCYKMTDAIKTVPTNRLIDVYALYAAIPGDRQIDVYALYMYRWYWGRLWRQPELPLISNSVAAGLLETNNRLLFVC